MADKKRYNYKKVLKTTIWLLLASGVVVLLVAAMTKNDADIVSRVNINITGVQNHYFLDKKEVIGILEKVNKRKLENSAIGSINLSGMENELEKDQWIRKVEMFFDNNKVLQVNIDEREPVARIFTVSGNSFYIDTALTRLTISDKFSARVPVFTNFPTDVIILKKRDSALLKDIAVMSNFIANDPFWMAQIEQLDITPLSTFELIPKLGNQIIRFGTADNYKAKFENLLSFYKKIQTRIGWQRYSVLDLQFLNQVVAIKRDAKEVKADSLKAIQVMKQIIAEAKLKMNDSTNVQLESKDNIPTDINQSKERDESVNETIKETILPRPVLPKIEPSEVIPNKVNEVKSIVPKDETKKVEIRKPAVKNIPAKKESSIVKPAKKPAAKKEPEIKREPKAVMPAKTDD
jgi:cell division protein FtsQ